MTTEELLRKQSEKYYCKTQDRQFIPVDELTIYI